MNDLERRIKAKIPGPDTGIEVRKSICTICDPMTQCGLDVFVKDGKILKVEGSEGHPYNRGALCPKGASTRQYVYSEDRLKTPLRRVGPRGSGAFEPISWEEALDTIAQKCLEAKADYGPESVVFFSGYTKFFRPFLKRMALSFGSPNYCTESSTCHQATALAQKLTFGQGGGPDIKNTECLIVWSANPFYTNPGNGKNIQAALDRGMKMIVVDPRLTPTAAKATLHLQLRPGTDGALALAIGHLLIKEGLYDADFCRDYTYGFEDYKKLVADCTPAWAEERTGVPASRIVEAARMIGRAKSACVLPSASPVVHHTNGVQNYRAIFSLIAITGNFDRPGGNCVKVESYLHVTGGIATNEHKFELSADPSKMAKRVGEEVYPVWMESLPGEAQAMCVPEQLRTADPYPIRVILGFGMNYRMWPDSDGFLKAIDEKLDFLAVTDLFMTDTCRHADIVLPACSSLERYELRCYGMNYIQLASPVIDKLYDSRWDLDIIFELARRICPEDTLLCSGYESCINYILEPSGLTFEELKKHPGGMFVPHPLPYIPKKYEKEPLKTPSGKVELRSKVLEKYGEKPGLESLPVYHPPKYSKEAAPEMAKEYPLILNSGSRLPMFVHTRTYRLSWTSSLRPNAPSADLSPTDAKSFGVAEGDRIRVSTPFGSIELTAHITGMVQPGVVHIYHGSSKADVNELFEYGYGDPISGFPGYKSALCKLEKIEG